ncbi:MAG TPA: AbrB family transcriptional regulator [Kiritimatiellia bacterium]|nr:AbrB family transcriptional regulator [Kiritimatiellia bacterium]HMO99723.1 AbrB family transcriptional regulator [Kiritimatiellia bacterium]HMP97422.1 AbrB family transcriptional regulator [Kiritimatiellia bacterium]
MTIKTKVRKIGNSYGIVLPKEALHQLKAKEGDAIYLTDAPGCAMRLTTDHKGFAEKAAVAENLMNRYRNALSELAK